MNLNECVFLQCSVHLSLTANKHQNCGSCIITIYKFPPQIAKVAIQNPPQTPPWRSNGATAPLIDRDRRPCLLDQQVSPLTSVWRPDPILGTKTSSIIHQWPLSMCYQHESYQHKVKNMQTAGRLTRPDGRCYFPSLWMEKSPVCHFCPSLWTDKSGQCRLFSVHRISFTFRPQKT